MQQWGLLIALAFLGVSSNFISIEIPHTSVHIDGKALFAFLGFAMLRRWYMVLPLALLIGLPRSSGINYFAAYTVNLAFFMPSLFAIRLIIPAFSRKINNTVVYGFACFILVIALYGLIAIPVMWGSLALLKGQPVLSSIVSGVQKVDLWFEAVLIGLLFAGIMSAYQSTRQLRATKHLLELALHSARMGAWEFNIPAQTVEWAGEHAKLFGFPLDHSGGNIDAIQDAVHPEDRPKNDQIRQKAIEENIPFDSTYRVVWPDGEVRWMHSYGQPILNEQGQVDRIVGTTRDITEEVNANEEREKLQQQLNQAQRLESIGRLAGGVAHDFNNMLNVIMGNAELAMDDAEPDTEIHESLQGINRAAHRSADLTRQLLAFARRQTISPKDINLNDLITNMLSMLRRLIGEGINLRWNPFENEVFTHIDPSQVDQILVNLLVNARDAIEGEGKITIETSFIEFDSEYCADHSGFIEGDYVMLAVSDNGSGMDKETQAQIFEPFYTTKGPNEGTGLGLATVYGIVKQNHGFINIYSEPDIGTTFRIYLPRIAPDTVAKTMETKAAPSPRGDETILLIEDENAMLGLTKRMLEKLGYCVLPASTPKTALELAEENKDKIDLLITDVILPEMNGRELSSLIQKHCPDIGIVYMSGYSANVIAHHGALDPGIHFLQKPFTTKPLADIIRRALAD